MQGVFFVLYILIVSGLIAVVGDRVGYRIGKKRLTWFNLRPRDTAVLVAILTGMIISALTLASLLLINRTLANALFNYERTVSYYTLYANVYSQKVDELETILNEVTIQRSDAQERLAQLQEQLRSLDEEKETLEQEIEELRQTALTFRRGEFGILAGEILTTGVIVTPPEEAPALERQRQLQLQLQEILSQAENRARELGATPTPPLQTAVQIRKEDVAELLNQVSEPGSWVVRIVSISNRLVEESVPVIADVNPNHQIFAEGAVLAQTTIPPDQDQGEIQRELLGLLSVANVRSQEAGLLADPLRGTVGEFSQVKLLEVVQDLEEIQVPTQVEVVTQKTIYTAGPLSVSLRIKPAPTS